MIKLRILSSVLFTLLVLHGCTAQFFNEDQKNEIKQLALDEMVDNFEIEFRKKIDLDAEVQRFIDDLDIAQEFKDLTGLSVGAVITIIIVIIIIPNLIIMLLIFLCCYCCKCGVFYRGKPQQNYNNGQNQAPQSQNSQYQTRGPANPGTTAPTPALRPEVRPNNQNQSAPPNKQSGSAWPWVPSGHDNRQASPSPSPQPSKPVWPWNNNQNANTPSTPTGHQNPNYKSQW